MMGIEESYGIKAAFHLVPEGSYRVSPALLQEMRDRGFEINIQDLNHDGHLFNNRAEFMRRVKKINEYGRNYGARGFRSAVLYRNLNWLDALDFSFDTSVPNVAHVDPQRGGCATVMPYFIGNILEIPVTTTQDYTLFQLLNDYSLDLWKAQSEAILAKNGLLNFLIHPDYVIESRARKAYRGLLDYLRELGSRLPLWFALPGEVDEWWRLRNQMSVVNRGGRWRVEGPGAERAVVAFARNAGDHIKYEFETPLRMVDTIASGTAAHLRIQQR